MVAGDGVGTQACLELLQRQEFLPQLGHAAVHQIAGDGHQVGIQAVDPLDDALQVAGLDGRADVQVAELDDAQPLQGGGQCRQGQLHLLDLGGAPGVVEATQRHQQHQPQHHPGAAGTPGGVQRVANQTGERHHHTAQQTEHCQAGKHAHGDQRRPGQQARVHVPRAKTQRHQDEGQDQQGPQRQLTGKAEAKIADDADADEQVQDEKDQVHHGAGAEHGRLSSEEKVSP